MSHHITPLVINSLGGGLTHIHTDVYDYDYDYLLGTDSVHADITQGYRIT